MAFYPYTHLLPGPSHTIAIAGPYIHIISTTTGSVLHSTRDDHENRAALLKAGPVRCAAIDAYQLHLATTADDKMLRIYSIDGLALVNERELPKKPTAICFTADGQTVLVADKFGDVFSYPLKYTPPTAKQKRDALSSHENPSDGTLILGHVSPLNALLLAPGELYILTADRDEHIRVSWYPEGYNIERYCLGHRKFVSALYIPPSAPSRLVSGGGDPYLMIWDWMSGEVVRVVQIAEAVDQYIAVRTRRRQMGPGKKRKPEKEKGKTTREGNTGVKGQDKEEKEDNDGSEDVNPREDDSEGQKVLVVHKISSLHSEGRLYLVFCAVGATALFALPFPEDSSEPPSALDPESASPDLPILHYDFRVPVIDFSIAEDVVLVCLDAEWTSDGENSIHTKGAMEESGTLGSLRMIRVVKFKAGALMDMSEDGGYAPLCTSLNGPSLISDTSENIRKLDLYADLTGMPKYRSDQGDVGDEGDEGDTRQGTPSMSNTAKGKGKADRPIVTEPTSKKALGRLKSKLAVQAKAKVVGVGLDTQESVHLDKEEPKVKRARSELKDYIAIDDR